MADNKDHESDSSPLEYRSPGSDPPYQPRTPMGWQMAAGFAAWILGLITIFRVLRQGAPVAWHLFGPDAAYCVIGGTLIALGALTIWLRLRFRWRGFLPGILIGFGLTCLVPAGIVAVICFGPKMH